LKAYDLYLELSFEFLTSAKALKLAPVIGYQPIKAGS